jgi:hypothetical protein
MTARPLPANVVQLPPLTDNAAPVVEITAGSVDTSSLSSDAVTQASAIPFQDIIDRVLNKNEELLRRLS